MKEAIKYHISNIRNKIADYEANLQREIKGLQFYVSAFSADSTRLTLIEDIAHRSAEMLQHKNELKDLQANLEMLEEIEGE